MAATARHRKALILSLSLFLLASGASGRNHENRRLHRSGLDEQPSVGPPPTRIVGASEWPAAAALSGFSAGAGVCQAFPPPLPNESKAT